MFERERRPAKAPLLSGALLAVIAIMASLAATSWWLDDRSQAVSDRHRQLAANIERIRYYDEALTMSARLAAASSDLSYRDRYDGLAPELDALIADTIRLAANPSAEAQIRATDTANVRLVQLEREAFGLVEQGRGDEALRLLAGSEYQAEKQSYSIGLEGAITAIDNAARAEDQQAKSIRLLIPIMSIVGGLVIAGVWLRYRRSTTHLLSDANLNAQRSAVFARLSDRLTFAIEERDLVDAAISALAMLTPSASGNLLLLNAAQDRLSVSQSWGDAGDPLAQLPQLDRPNQCPGLRRGIAHLAADLSDPLAVRCPAHPIDVGSLLCVPLLALGQSVGVLHLARDRSGFTADDLWLAGRLAEQVALALANGRLLRSMEDLAMADPLTGLYNMRFFDPLLERELALAERDDTAVGLIMLDIDHFKRFNDANGHPAGDEALRTFADLLRASIRESDTVARYGGEEFVILLRGAGLDDAAAMAEKLRAEVEKLVVVLGPGQFAHVTGSFGVGSTVTQGHDRTALIAAVDHALYRAKELGRNRVVIAEPVVTVPPVIAQPEAGGHANAPRARSTRRKRDASAPTDAAVG